MFGYAPPEMTWDRGDIEHKIDEMPTIDAIPVAWIINEIGIALKDNKLIIPQVLENLILKWQKEQEASE